MLEMIWSYSVLIMNLERCSIYVYGKTRGLFLIKNSGVAIIFEANFQVHERQSKYKMSSRESIDAHLNIDITPPPTMTIQVNNLCKESRGKSDVLKG
jgi:hypothetical protein